MSQPGDKLEQSIIAELGRIQAGTAAPAEDAPLEDDAAAEQVEEEVEEEGLEAGPGEEEEEEEGEEEDGGERVQQDPPPKAKHKPGRANEQIKALRRRAQEAEARLAADQAQRIAAEQQQAALAAQAEDRRIQAEIAALPPEEQGPAKQDAFNRKVAQNLTGMQRQMADGQDQLAFQTAAASDPILKALSPKVEQIAAQYRAQGNVVNRETIANYLLGQLARSTEGRRLLMQSQTPKKRTKTPTSRGDSGRGGGGGGSSKQTGGGKGEPTRAQLAARLKDQPI